MFDSLTSRLESTFRRLSGRGTLGPAEIDEAMGEIRVALLEADVNFKVVKEFCERVRSKALGAELKKSLTPGQTVVKYVYEELVHAMGQHTPLGLRHAPPVILMLVGLQGSGKTTSCAKLARYLRDELKRRPLLVPADVYRPAAIEQLKTLGKALKIEVFDSSADQDPVDIAKRAVTHARAASFDTVILDTAGRLQIDEEMMNELIEIVETVEPHEILLVADAMTGQAALDVAKGFDSRLDIDGIVLTKLDGDARGGAALSMRSATEKPIKFVGVGEKTEALEPFHPDRMASRILGMGDMLTLIEKASKKVDLEQAEKLHTKLKKDEFTLEDFHSQLQTIKSMGSMTSLLQMVPGMGKMAQGINEETADREMKRVEAIILSMTPKERSDASIINGSRRKRIAGGSGTTVEEVNRLLKQFEDMRHMMKKLTKMGPKALRGLAGMKGMPPMGRPR